MGRSTRLTTAVGGSPIPMMRPGNRITKTAGGVTSVYVRDVQGNILSIYNQTGSGSPVQQEVDLYGSSRLGSVRALTVAPTTVTLGGVYGVATTSTFTRGEKSYELTNHLGNVLSTITDKKIAVVSGSNSSLIDHFTADIATAQDFYPFGMLMPGRTYTASTATNYRFGFNGKENDNEVKGVGDEQDYGQRYYDPRVGKFLSVDPLTEKYPWYTPYQFSGNTPIWATDLDGLEPNPSTQGIVGKEEHESTTTSVWVGNDRMKTEMKETWYWHAGSSEYGTKAGWYNEEDYNKTIKPIIVDLAEFGGLFRGASNGGMDKNWTPEQQDNVVNTRLGRYMSSLPENVVKDVFNPGAISYAQERAANVDGRAGYLGITPVDFFLGAGEFKLATAESKILGEAQVTGTLGHAFTSRVIAWRYALDPSVERVTLDLGYKRLLGEGTFRWGPRPDVGIFFKNGTVKIFEVQSATDISSKLFNKNFFFMQRWSIPGEVQVIKPFSLKALYK